MPEIIINDKSNQPVLRGKYPVSKEPIIYINEGCHTGQLQDASQELAHRTLQIIGRCVENIGLINRTTDPQVLPLKLRSATSDAALSSKTQRVWTNDEKWVARLAVMAGILSYPHRVDLRISEHLSPVSGFSTAAGAILFFSSEAERVRYLLSPQARQRLDSLKFSSFAYVESRVLRRAVFDGVYLTKPTPEL